MNNPVLNRHEQAFPCQPRPTHVAHAPGRVNLIGEHTDYQEGFVMPIALPVRTSVSIGPRNDDKWVFHSAAMNDTLTLDRAGADAVAPPPGHWQSYVYGVLCEIKKLYDVPPANLLVSSNVPVGAGLSSSAALEVAAASALCAHARVKCGGLDLAALCRRAENHYAGMPCGIMDQCAAVLARRGRAMKIDCRSLEIGYCPIPPELLVFVVNTGVKHALATSAYADRVRECNECVALLQESRPSIRTLRDATFDDVMTVGPRMTELLQRRCLHVISENWRTILFGDLLRLGQWQPAGRLMFHSHDSLRELYEVSCAELDDVVNVLRDVDGVIGARMTGGGFGGCVVALVRRDAARAVHHAIQTQYNNSHDIAAEVWEFEPSDGVVVERLA